MAADRRRREVVLAVALLALGVAAYWLWPRPSSAAPLASNQGAAAGSAGPAGTSAGDAPRGTRAPAEPARDQADKRPAPAPPRGARAARPTPTPAPGAEAPSVHLTVLEAARPKPVEAERNLFRFKPKPTPPPPPPASSRVDRSDAGPETPPVPSGPPPPPPITLKFIGLVEQGSPAQKIAVLTDSTGRVSYGHEGEIIEGRYRILKIGAESLEIAYLDGTGRRTVRLSGG